jgi:predicted dehydrogenase
VTAAHVAAAPGHTDGPLSPTGATLVGHVAGRGPAGSVRTLARFEPYDRPVRAAFVGLGRIYDLNVRAYLDNPDVEVVALVDPSDERRAERQSDFPAAKTFASVAELGASGLEVDAVEALLPIPLHAEGVIDMLGRGWHVNLQKPICSDLAAARLMLEAAQASDRVLRVMENYLFYEPLRRLKQIVESGEIGEVAGYHMKMVGTGRGGWEVPASSYEWQFQQMQRGRGILVFDDGWHKLSTALWLFGPIKEVRAWIGTTPIVPGVIEVDAPTTIVWEHTNGIRGVWDITLAHDMYLRSDYYTNDERWEVTGRRGYARVNRCTGRGIQQPSLEVYVDGELRGYHALDDDWGSSFRDSGRHWLRWLHSGEGPLLWSGDEAVEVLRFALAAYESSASGGIGVSPTDVG